MNKRTTTTIRALIWTLCLCMVTGLQGAEAAEPSTAQGATSHSQPDADALGKNQRRRRAPRRAPRKKRAPKKKIPPKKKKAPKTDDVGARAYDLGYTMGVLSGASLRKGPQAKNAHLFISSAQQARNALAEKVSFKGFKSVRLDIGFKDFLNQQGIISARNRYQANIEKRRGKRVEVSYVFGLQMGIAEVMASQGAGMNGGDLRAFIAPVLHSIGESDLSELGLEIALMQHAVDLTSGSKISPVQASKIHAAVLKARLAYRHPIAKAPASFWAKKKTKKQKMKQ